MKLASPVSRQWTHYEFPPAFVLGFHGCDATVGEAILRGEAQHLTASANDYDWLGHGIYFWEGNPARALQFAAERAAGGRNSQGEITRPFVLGAILNLRRCLDLADSSAIEQVENAYVTLRQISEATTKYSHRTDSTLKHGGSTAWFLMPCTGSAVKKTRRPTTRCAACSGKAVWSTLALACGNTTTSKSACATPTASSATSAPF